MRLAILADIHANLPALEAALSDLEERGEAEAVFHLGDLVGYAPWPNEVVARLREEGIGGVAGNYDSTVAAGADHCGCRYEDPRQEELSHLSYEWTCRHVLPETRAYLGALPFRIDLRPRGGHTPGPKVVLVHGAPTLNTLYWTEERPDSFCLKMASIAGLRPGDWIVFGHTHKPWHRTLEGMHFVNAGSVGRPKDGDPRACYLLLEVEGGRRARQPSEGRAAEQEPPVEFVRVPYDVERAARAIVESGLPEEFGEHLRTGGAP